MMKIKESTLEFIVGACENTFPKEFIGLLRARGDVVKEVLVIPGTETNEHSATLKKHMVPPDPGIVGSVHSHPTRSGPSKADLEFFRTGGKFHLLVLPPFEKSSVKAFDSSGEEIDLKVIKE